METVPYFPAAGNPAAPPPDHTNTAFYATDPGNSAFESSFQADLAQRWGSNPEVAAKLDRMTAVERNAEMDRHRRRFAYRSSPPYADAHGIYQLVNKLHDRMRRFVADHDPGQGVAILAAAGVSPPPPDGYEDQPADEFRGIFEAIAGHEFNAGLLLAALWDVAAPPPADRHI